MPGPGNMHPDRYKTQICRDWARGSKCAHADKCWFAHGEHELRTRPPPSQPAANAPLTQLPLPVSSGLLPPQKPSRPAMVPAHYVFDEKKQVWCPPSALSQSDDADGGEAGSSSEGRPSLDMDAAKRLMGGGGIEVPKRKRRFFTDAPAQP